MKLAEFVKQNMACIESIEELPATVHSNNEISHELPVAPDVAFIDFQAQAMIMLGYLLGSGKYKVVDFVINDERVWIRFSEHAFEHGHNVLVASVYRADEITVRCCNVKFRKNKGM
jgi:hypothetical protein